MTDLQTRNEEVFRVNCRTYTIVHTFGITEGYFLMIGNIRFVMGLKSPIRCFLTVASDGVHFYEGQNKSCYSRIRLKPPL